MTLATNCGHHARQTQRQRNRHLQRHAVKHVPGYLLSCKPPRTPARMPFISLPALIRSHADASRPAPPNPPLHIPHGWHTRATVIPSLPPPYFLRLALGTRMEGMAGGAFSLALFYPNLALDEHGTALVLEQRDWDALVRLAQMAACLAPPDTPTSDRSYWSIAHDYSCASTTFLMVPSPASLLMGYSTGYLYSSLGVVAWGPHLERFTLGEGGQLPMLIYELFKVLYETSNEHPDAVSPRRSPWPAICRHIESAYGENRWSRWCSLQKRKAEYEGWCY
jgi:hypothetical protein